MRNEMAFGEGNEGGPSALAGEPLGESRPGLAIRQELVPTHRSASPVTSQPGQGEPCPVALAAIGDQKSRHPLPKSAPPKSPPPHTTPPPPAPPHPPMHAPPPQPPPPPPLRPSQSH